MSLNTIQQDRDLFRVKTAQFQKRTRFQSQNLDNHDIEGKRVMVTWMQEAGPKSGRRRLWTDQSSKTSTGTSNALVPAPSTFV